tara:strand:- start:2892 stop:3692 length:801 start_codon:yes stop_codon:yes gene_type:complete
MKDYILRNIVKRNQSKYIVKSGTYFKYCVDITEYGGIAFYFNLDHVFKDHFYLIDNFCEPDSVCVDVGANLGMISLYCAYKNLNVVSIEPDEINFNLLRLNSSINNFNNIKALKTCIGNKDGFISFFKNPNNAGTHSTIKDEILNDWDSYSPIDGFDFEDIIEVKSKIKKLDSLDLFDKPISYLKIDTEGNELDVLKGATKLFKQNPPKIVVLEDRANVERYRNRSKEYFKILLKFNYSINYFCNHKLTKNKDERTNFSDVVFVLK